MELWLVILISISVSIATIAPLIIFLLVYYKHRLKKVEKDLNFYKNMKPLEVKQCRKRISTLASQKMIAPQDVRIPYIDDIVKDELWNEFSEELKKRMTIKKEERYGRIVYKAEFEVVEDD